MNKPILTLVGFVVFCIGFLSVIFSMVGLHFSFLGFIDGYGVLTIVIQIILILGGMVMMYVSRMPKDED